MDRQARVVALACRVCGTLRRAVGIGVLCVVALPHAAQGAALPSPAPWAVERSGGAAIAADAASPSVPALPAPTPPAAGSTAAGANTAGTLDVEKLFANTCGWCHSNAGRTAGRGPQLMGTTLTDAEIISRIKNGKAGAMPSFATAFTDDQLRAIVAYIRGLKEEGASK